MGSFRKKIVSCSFKMTISMKKTASIFLAMVMCALFSAYAQAPQTAVAEQSQPASDGATRLAAIVSTPQSEWLGNFNQINVIGAMQVTFIRIAGNEAPKIYYDTKGSTTTKFKAEVDKKGVLNVIETVDAKRTTITEVKIYYTDVESISVSGADATMEQPYDGKMFDIAVSGGASLRAKVNVSDLAMEVTGRSSVVIDGYARYMGLNVSTAKFEAMGLETMAMIVDASHGAEVSLFVTERLEAVTSTSAKITYKGNPSIVRLRSSLFGGEIICADK